MREKWVKREAAGEREEGREREGRERMRKEGKRGLR